MRTVHAAARVWDGSNADPAAGEIAIQDGRIVDVGPNLDGDERVEHPGQTNLPWLFDCHVHVVLGTIDLIALANQPFSYQFFLAAQNLQATLRAGITSVRDAGGADLGIKQAIEDGLIAGPRLQVSLA